MHAESAQENSQQARGNPAFLLGIDGVIRRRRIIRLLRGLLIPRRAIRRLGRLLLIAGTRRAVIGLLGRAGRIRRRAGLPLCIAWICTGSIGS